MMPLPPLDIPALLRRFDLHPSKCLGQNFLTDGQALQEIVRAAEITPDDPVLEIGPGLGSLTRLLAQAARQVTAVELDGRLFPALRYVLAPHANIRLVQADILELDPAGLMDGPGYLVVANIPYYITSAVIRHLLESRCAPRRIILTIQQEVAKRICAQPGDLSLLALSVQVFGQPQVMAVIPAASFHPQPKVDSAVLRVDLHTQPVIPAGALDLFFDLARAGFSQKRKTLRNSLSAGMHIPPAQAEARLTQAGIDPQRRAETLSLAEWKRLCEIYT
jgi:16S rRNA (adenine1518-N6/adenine1519-N6)-dimethyltransferase